MLKCFIVHSHWLFCYFYWYEYQRVSINYRKNLDRETLANDGNKKLEIFNITDTNNCVSIAKHKCNGITHKNYISEESLNIF